MKNYKYKIAQFLTLLLLVLLSSSCTLLNSSREFEISKTQVQKLNEQIKTGQFNKIYRDSRSLQEQISEEKFISQMTQAVEKLKELDETLNFQEYEAVTTSLQGILEGRYESVNIQKIEKNARTIMVMTFWNRKNEDENWQFSSCSFIESFADGKSETFKVPQSIKN